MNGDSGRNTIHSDADLVTIIDASHGSQISFVRVNTGCGRRFIGRGVRVHQTGTIATVAPIIKRPTVTAILTATAGYTVMAAAIGTVQGGMNRRRQQQQKGQRDTKCSQPFCAIVVTPPNTAPMEQGHDTPRHDLFVSAL
jgi:hypothetical protein